ncbi:MAG: general L-amino acid transport system permease protein [Candidatus Endobugula sp.]
MKYNRKIALYVEWCKVNLFATWLNSVITVVLFYALLRVFLGIADWTIINASWSIDKASCTTASGACWSFIMVNFQKFMYGFYPEAERWRVNTIILGLIALMAAHYFVKPHYKRVVGISLLLVYPVVVFVLLLGGVFGLTPVDTSEWGGLMLTVVIAIVGIVGAFPLGVLLALGRRSKLPIVKTFCVFFIEIWRAVPLVTVLVMAAFMIPLFLPDGMNFNELLRAMIGIILFQSAYLAEVIRGGLQAVPKGQYEAGSAMGLTYWQSMRKVVLPQALEISIPGIVNQFIALFKDTSLVVIIGLFDLLGIIKTAFQDPAWLGDYFLEGYLFAILIYWIFCYGMSLYSQQLEKKLSVKSH